MVPGTVSQPRLLRAMIERRALMAVLIAVSWTVLFILMGVTVVSAILAAVIAGGIRFVCFGGSIVKLK
jgi:hypothetical protein